MYCASYQPIVVTLAIVVLCAIAATVFCRGLYSSPLDKFFPWPLSTCFDGLRFVCSHFYVFGNQTTRALIIRRSCSWVLRFFHVTPAAFYFVAMFLLRPAHPATAIHTNSPQDFTMKCNVGTNTLQVNINLLNLVHELCKDISRRGSTCQHAFGFVQLRGAMH